MAKRKSAEYVKYVEKKYKRSSIESKIRRLRHQIAMIKLDLKFSHTYAKDPKTCERKKAELQFRSAQLAQLTEKLNQCPIMVLDYRVYANLTRV